MEGFTMKSHTGLLTMGFSLALFLALPGAGAISQSKEVSTEALAAQAEVVAVGKVSSLVPQWNEDHSRIVTRVTLSVQNYIKGGTAGQLLTLLVPGGEIDGVGELYSHTAVFQSDENVLVFAQKDPQGNYRVSAGQQGKYTVKKDDASGQLMVGGTRTLQEVTALVQKAVLDKQQK
jgi:hypothetical protein